MEGKAGRGTSSQSRLPPPAPTPARRRPAAPAPLVVQGRVPAAGRGPGNSTADSGAVSGEEAVGAWRGGRSQASRLLPFPPADNDAPAPPPAPASGRQAPGPQPAPTAGPTLGLPSFSLP